LRRFLGNISYKSLFLVPRNPFKPASKQHSAQAKAAMVQQRSTYLPPSLVLKKKGLGDLPFISIE
jgi:hypothetical protein